ncbi:Multidrug resistance protein MdtC [Frankliniella fusca]|uniref:Multidrug resistance protein MdtC n=1 Tax=Frankliniella fusca TaxID=407009 RepID=A0AAE1LDJ0_9NEOP|nr:Multidrug resistance protein MdtC [Frankliniella fusca]
MKQNISSSPCSHCSHIPPTLLINTTLVNHSGLSRTEWKVVSSTSKELSTVEEQSKLGRFYDESNSDLNHGRKLGSCGEKNAEECSKELMKKKKHTAIQVSTSLANESTQVLDEELELIQSPVGIVPRGNSTIRGRGSRGRRGRGGGRQRRGSCKADLLSNDPQQTRSFRPRKSTCYLELPDEVEDYVDDEDDDGIKKHFPGENKAEDFGNVSLKKLKKMLKKKSQSIQPRSHATEKNEFVEETDATHGKNPLLLKLAKKTDSGAEWKVETVTKSEDLSTAKFELQDASKEKGEASMTSDEVSKLPSQKVLRERACSTDDALLSEQESVSYPCSLSDSDIAVAKSPKLEELKKCCTCIQRGSKKRKIFIKPKTSGALFRKAMKECSEKLKMKPTTPLKTLFSSSKDTTVGPVCYTERGAINWARLAAKKHWLNFHQVPGGSTSPSQDISGPDLSSNVIDEANSAAALLKPNSPLLSSVSSSQPLSLLPALQPLSNAPYAVPVQAASTSSFSYAPNISSSQVSSTYQGAIVPNPLVSSGSLPEKEEQAPLDLPVRFLDTI